MAPVTTTVRLTNLQDAGRPLPGFAQLEFSPSLSSHLHWDPTQPHPVVSAPLDADGYATFALRGGACWSSGVVSVTWEHLYPHDWIGAHSTDPDGDCAVTSADVDYVQSRLGSADFCADVDGSGLVDTTDLAMVQSRLGEHCYGAAAVASPTTSTEELLAWPNPLTQSTRITLRNPLDTEASLDIIDASGRRIRTLGPARAEAGEFTWTWDGRTDSGERVASGVYFSSALTSHGAIARRLILVAR